MNSGTAPFSSTSYAHGGSFKGRIESIVDPENRGRVQVRIGGYQDDKGNITPELLEWIHVSQHNSQLPGATSTQPYYVGATVLVSDTGTEKYVTGAVAGFDGEKRESGQVGQADNSNNQKPDTPNILRGDKHTAIASSPGLQPSSTAGANTPFSFKNWDSMVKHFYPYAIGKGEAPAPFGKGTSALLDTFQSLAHTKLENGSDILDNIKQLDGNISGAIKASVDIIKNLRNGGFGTGMSTIGSGNIGAADAQFNGTFGAVATGSNLNVLLTELLAAIQFIKTLKGSNLLDNLDAVQSTLTLMSNDAFNVDTNALTIIQNELDTIRFAGDNQINQYYVNEAVRVQELFHPVFLMAMASIMDKINSIAALTPSSHVDTVNSLGGLNGFTQMGQSLASAASILNVPITSIASIANGLMGKAIQGNLADAVGNLSGLISNSPIPQVTALMNKFVGNPNALQELLGGQLVKDFLSKNPLKYEDDDRNHGAKVLKKFADGFNGDSKPSASPPDGNYPDYGNKGIGSV